MIGYTPSLSEVGRKPPSPIPWWLHIDLRDQVGTFSVICLEGGCLDRSKGGFTTTLVTGHVPPGQALKKGCLD